ncbi:MAG: type II secretion system F family protein [Candidatus Liptonbacteria bacterium]|nr:type II secretion system F family protein [Candidatus Liptonbacteria bacterium]
MKFKYRAKTKEGEDQTGFVEAPNREGATSILSGHNLFILSIEPAGKAGMLDRLLGYFGRVKRKDKVIFFRQLATLLEARIPISSALRSLHAQTASPALKEAIFEMGEDIDSGLSFSQAMGRREGVFSDFYVSMVQASETTGRLEEVIGFLADYTEKEDVLAGKAIGAMTYPALVVGMFGIVAFVMVAFVFPQIKPVFDQAGVDLPWMTKLLLGAGGFLGSWWPLVLLALVFGGIFVLDYFRTPEGRAALDDSKVRLPLVNKIYLPLVLSRFSYTTSLLLKGGIPVAQAFEIVSHVVSNALYEELLHEISEAVRSGETISGALRRYPDYFPPLVSQMIAVGEQSGQLSQIFGRVAGFYEREADAVINNIVDLLQPLLIGGIGILVGLLFASILLPLYQLTSSSGLGG